MRIAVITILLIFSVGVLFFCFDSDGPSDAAAAKINGMSLESPPNEIGAEKLDAIVSINANWVAIIPYGFSRLTEPDVHFNSSRQWWGEREEGVTALVKMAHSKNLKVMLKPQVWVHPGWVGVYAMNSDEEWRVWEKSYEAYILAYARVAQDLKAEIFCIGTEYKIAAVQRVAFWSKLIVDVRQIYSGQLTYAANWDEFMLIDFWDQLDFIGVNAYFPLLDGSESEVEIITAKWSKISDELKIFSTAQQLPILFTEFGYRSAEGAAGKQWEIDGSKHSMQEQKNAFDAFFRTFWKQEWVAGGFVWKWHFAEGAGGLDDSNYTPQGKPALKIIENAFKAD